ncbi:MAG: glycyl-radical enzyme activating protein [Candidatus Oleimicrobiaceae bacterium]
MTGIVFNIQRYSIRDGPGIRTTVFLKGCPLRCFWCHNPEGLNSRVEIMYHPRRCIGCGACVRACTQAAHALDKGRHRFSRRRCQGCGECAAVCPTQALVRCGQHMSSEEVVAEALRDVLFYRTSQGGVTVSGGEPLQQAQFAAAILKRCKEAGVHTALDTSGVGEWEQLATLLPVTDLVILDIKHVDSKKHREATGASCSDILANAARLMRTKVGLLIRIPVVPGFNDGRADMHAIVDVLHAMAMESDRGWGRGEARLAVELLPFHKLAAEKYHALGRRYRATRLEPPSEQSVKVLREMFAACGFSVES